MSLGRRANLSQALSTCNNSKQQQKKSKIQAIGRSNVFDKKHSRMKSSQIVSRGLHDNGRQQQQYKLNKISDYFARKCGRGEGGGYLRFEIGDPRGAQNA